MEVLRGNKFIIIYLRKERVSIMTNQNSKRKPTKKTKITALFLLAVIAVGLFAGCSGTKTNSGKTVDLKYVMMGPGMQQDSEIVWEAFNKKLAEKIPGVKVTFEVIPTAEYAQKFLLMNSAREKMDIAGNYGTDFHTEVKNGTFLPLDDLLQKYGQETLKTLPDWFMDYQKVDGVTYGIPSYQMCAVLRGVVFFKEQADKFLDLEAFKKALYSSSHDTREMYDILEKYMDDLKAAGYKFNGSVKAINARGWESLKWPYGIEYGDKEAKVVNYVLSENSRMHYEVSARWAKKGYIKEDALTNTVDYKGQLDGVPFWDVGYTPFIQAQLSETYGEEVIVVPYYEKDYIGYVNSAGGTSIMANCEDPEKAMQVINLLQTDKELYNLLVFGIEGTHYEKTGEDSIKPEYNLQGSSTDAYGIFKWIVGNTQLAYNCPSEPDEYKKWVFEESNMSDFRSPLIGFYLDNSKSADYLTQANYVNEKYYEPLLAGVYPDWEKAYKEFENELNAVGNKEILKDFQEQVDNFLKQK